MVEHIEKEAYSWVRQRTIHDYYCITEPGKEYLVRNETEQGRVA